MGWLRSIYRKLFRINDSPQKVAIGLGLGVFFGIMPGMGPFIALCFAFIFRVNRAAALLGSLLTNTWLSLVTFVLAARMGSFIMGVDYGHISQEWSNLWKNFTWSNLVKMSASDIVVPLVTGYITISLCIGILTYLAALIILRYKKRSG